MSGDTRTIHASCVAIEGHGLLICGGSGAGKTALLVELLRRGAQFVADDGVVISQKEGRIWASSAKGNKGLIGISPGVVAVFADVFPDAKSTQEALVGLCVMLEGETEQGSKGLLADIPKLNLERGELTSMADICERTVISLIA